MPSDLDAAALASALAIGADYSYLLPNGTVDA
jgi:hypothetical protein